MVREGSNKRLEPLTDIRLISSIVLKYLSPSLLLVLAIELNSVTKDKGKYIRKIEVSINKQGILADNPI